MTFKFQNCHLYPRRSGDTLYVKLQKEIERIYNKQTAILWIIFLNDSKIYTE